MTLEHYFMSTPRGRRNLASAKLRYEVLESLHLALLESGLSYRDLARQLEVRTAKVKSVLDGNGDIPVGIVAEYLEAMGYGIQLRVESRRSPTA